VEKPPAFQFYAKEFLTAVLAMSLEARGAYITLLAYEWDSLAIPGDDAEALGRLFGCSPSQARKLWEIVGRKFEQGADGLWRNERLEQQRAELEAFRVKQQQNGSKGGRPRKARPEPRGNPQLTQAFTQAIASAKPTESSSVCNTDQPTPNPSRAAGGARITRAERKAAEAELEAWRRERLPWSEQRIEAHRRACERAGQPPPDPSLFAGGPECWHTPVCADDDTCLGRIVAELRQRLAQGLALGKVG
jgi:uncharacterized protein YdaU (DUF1376 family)